MTEQPDDHRTWSRTMICGVRRVATGVILCQSFSASAIAAQATRDSTRATWIIPDDDAIRRLLADRLAHNGVGAVVGIIEPAGRRIITHGRSGAPDGRPLDGETVFQIGSVTKVFTGLVLADMAVRGEVGLEDPAAKYLPPGVSMPQRGRPITLIDLSKHWSALPSMPTNFLLTARPNPYQAYTAEHLHAFLNNYQLPREPGTQAYSNLGVALLGRLLARHAGMEYEPLLRQRVLSPLGLHSTSITVTADQRNRLAPGHDRFGQLVETWELLAMPASGSLRSTVNDLLTFLEFNLGVRETPLSAAMLLQRTPGRALGWGRSTLAGEGVYGHEGGKEGYRSAVIFNPRTRTGVVLLTNARTDESPMLIARHLLTGGGQLPPVRPALTRPAPVQVAPNVLDEYAGDYSLVSGGAVKVARRDDHLLVNVHGDGVSTVFPFGKDAFYANTEDLTITFARDTTGRVAVLVLHSPDEQRRANRLQLTGTR